MDAEIVFSWYWPLHEQEIMSDLRNICTIYLAITFSWFLHNAYDKIYNTTLYMELTAHDNIDKIFYYLALNLLNVACYREEFQ